MVLGLFFYFFQKSKKETVKIQLEIQYLNPFKKESQYVNPFDEYKNPFDLIRAVEKK